VFGLYAQATSLNKLPFFGLGPASTLAGRSFFGMTETIVGGNVVQAFFYERLQRVPLRRNQRPVCEHPGQP